MRAILVLLLAPALAAAQHCGAYASPVTYATQSYATTAYATSAYVAPSYAIAIVPVVATYDLVGAAQRPDLVASEIKLLTAEVAGARAELASIRARFDMVITPTPPPTNPSPGPSTPDPPAPPVDPNPKPVGGDRAAAGMALLVTRCASCHTAGSANLKGEFELFQKDGKTPATLTLSQLVRTDLEISSNRMPPRQGKFTADEYLTFRAWYNAYGPGLKAELKRAVEAAPAQQAAPSPPPAPKPGVQK